MLAYYTISFRQVNLTISMENSNKKGEVKSPDIIYTRGPHNIEDRGTETESQRFHIDSRGMAYQVTTI